MPVIDFFLTVLPNAIIFRMVSHSTFTCWGRQKEGEKGARGGSGRGEETKELR